MHIKESHIDRANTSKSKHDWLKKYRIWEANRKVLLYPENWLEPEFRDDKSRFFIELEDELLGIDMTEAIPMVRAELVALILIGSHQQDPSEFESLVKCIMTSASQDEHRSIIREPNRMNLHNGLWRVLGTKVPIKVDVVICLESNHYGEQIKDQITKDIIPQYFSRLRLGDSIYTSYIINLIMEIDGVSSVETINLSRPETSGSRELSFIIGEYPILDELHVDAIKCDERKKYSNET